MFVDTHAVRQLADGMHAQAEEIRARASELLAEAAAAPWQGESAEAMRRGAAHQSARMHHTADLHDDAAGALRDHAAQVDETVAVIAALEREARELVGAARERLSGLLGAVAGPLDHLLDRFVPPDPGSLDWLGVDLPGLHVPCLPGIAA